MNTNRLLFLLMLLMAGPSCRDNADPTPDPDLVYFLVGEKDEVRNQSYILALKDPNEIAEARTIANDPNDQRIVMAEITKSKSENYYINKDLTGGETWSWRVSKLIGFNDLSAEIYDGWPGYVEDNYNTWVTNTKGENGKGVIGFWNYTVIREVDKSELYEQD